MGNDYSDAKFRIFKVGPKNQRLESPNSPGTREMEQYRALVESDVPLDQLLEETAIEICPEDRIRGTEIFNYADEGKVERCFEIFEFPKRADYGRDGVDEYFVRERLQLFGYRPATFIELVCFGRCLRKTYEGLWFESKNIIALGSAATITEVIRKRRWLGLKREITGTYSYYPELICVAGRPLDQIRLSTTDKDKHGNWPNEVLFLGTSLQ
jgi:hypothetical protein